MSSTARSAFLRASLLFAFFLPFFFGQQLLAFGEFDRGL
jgi:hypothetical protein